MDKACPLIYVLWNDPASQDEWCEVKDICLTNKVITTFGQLTRETKENIVVSLNVDYEDEGVSCSIIIPQRAIIDRYIIEIK